jgi:sulfur-carrier protein
MSIKVLFFASLSEITRQRRFEVDASAFPDALSIYTRFTSEFPGLNVHRSSLLCSVNSEFARLDTEVHDGDEVAFFPPMSGG